MTIVTTEITIENESLKGTSNTKKMDHDTTKVIPITTFVHFLKTVVVLT